MPRESLIVFFSVSRAEIEFPVGMNPYADEVYKAARNNLEKMEADGALVRDDRPCYYV